MQETDKPVGYSHVYLTGFHVDPANIIGVITNYSFPETSDDISDISSQSDFLARLIFHWNS